MDIHYESNFLTNVIVRADFVKPLEIEEVEPDLNKIILKNFPRLEPRKLLRIRSELKVEPESKYQVEAGKESTEWNYFGKNRDKKVTIGPTFFSLHYIQSYSSFHNLCDEFFELMEAFLKTYSDVQVNRLGLRYINEINLPGPEPLKWDGYLNEKLLSALSIVEDEGIVARGFSELILNKGDMMLNFKYGMHNPDLPAPIKKKIFVLDYDAYFTSLQEIGDIKSNLEAAHDEIQKLFEDNIEDRLRDILHGR